MANSRLNVVVRQLRRLGAKENARTLQDRQLLDRFVTERDEGAFEALVARHGPMVLNVCRRVLYDPGTIDDAFQATFLVLVRKAASIRQRELLSNWLYGVAYRTAVRAKAESAKRRARESAAPVRQAVRRQADPLDEITVRELFAALDQHLYRLPSQCRAPLVLCYLEGKTRDEAARQLGCSLATLDRRLGRGRELLRARLARQGLTLSAALFSVMLAQSPATACVPGNLVVATLKAAVAVSAGDAAAGLVSARVAALTEGVLKTMLLNKLKTSAAVLLVLGFFAVGAGGWSYHTQAARAANAQAAAEPKAGIKKDSAGKGASDGDRQQRRELTYSVRAVIRVMPPYNLKELNDDYQDVRVRKETKEFVELEVVLYPFNANAESIKGNPSWKKDYAGMKEYLAPGITTNWDDDMRKDLLRALAKDGIDPDKLTDKEVVEQVSRWLFKRSQHRSMFCTFYVGFRDGKPVVLPGLEKAFERDKGDPRWTVQEQLEHELFGKEMFARKTYGTCTSTAVYQTTVLRALGIPTRMILCIPLADASDMAQVEMIDKGLTNHRVRHEACLGVISAGSSFASHTFCEVFVGGRWRRLNFTTLGQNILERNYLGLMIHVHTFNDLSEANLAATWGTRYARGRRDDLFPHSNPYRLLEVSDHFGKYAKVPNPPADKEHKHITIGKAYWPESKAAPAEIRELRWGKPPGSGRFFIHGQEWLEDAGGYLQYKLFMRRADPGFVLRAKEQPDVSCRMTMNFHTHQSRNLRELEVVIPAAAYATMAKGVAYTLHPVNGKKGYEWKVREGVTLTRE
jgi:RNA polymerase sigma factor (sigma-70 family)